MNDFLIGLLLLVTTFFLIGFLYYYALTSPGLIFDQANLPLLVKSLAKEAFQSGRMIMTLNDKKQIESYAGKKWHELDILHLNSIWVKEIQRLKKKQ